MKKLLLLFSIIICCGATYAQTLTATPSSVTTGGTITIKAAGESLSSNISNLGGAFLSVSVAAPNQGYTSDINGSVVSGTTTYYNTGTGAPTTFQFKPTSSAPVPVVVTYTFFATLQNLTSGGSTPTNVNLTFTVTINPPTTPSVFYNVAKSQTFYNNTCAAGTASDPYTYTVAARKYSSTVSQADADNKAQADINTNGQNLANANAPCKIVYYNTAISQSFTPACSIGYGYSGAAIPYNVPAGKYNSTVSQADANAKAQNEINTNGQASANTHCALLPVYARLTVINIWDGPRYRNADLLISFYSDAAGTQPVPVSNLHVSIQKNDYGNPQGGYSVTANGTTATQTGVVLIARNPQHVITDEYDYELLPATGYTIIP
jgi:hypothetical protein